MKKINLRDYYPYYTQDMIIEVPDEVADILREYKLAEAAYFLRTYRHKAYFSLDYDINVEHEAMVLVLTPADIFEQKEENARLYEALASLPKKQRIFGCQGTSKGHGRQIDIAVGVRGYICFLTTPVQLVPPNMSLYYTFHF